MSDKMIPLTAIKLLQIIQGELKTNNSIFGINRDNFFNPSDSSQLAIERYRHPLETPLGVAAGPHTQLSQNIISAWLCGARYIELKTVQVLDQLEVGKPCIDMEREGYNCEWSQELTLDQSFHEYLNAWVIIHILQNELGIKRQDGHLGTIFNMSVGYDLQGILSDKVQKFIQRMRSCPQEKYEVLEQLKPLYPKINQLEIPDQISNNITLSTMHGCPPDEIEKIGRYLIEDLKIDTTIKLNPTLLGMKDVRQIINYDLGYSDVTVPDEAFAHDLKYPDCVRILQNLTALAKKQQIAFSIKLTNTLEVVNSKDLFPKESEHSYLSGRPLHPLAVKLASKLQREFGGKLDITFSAGLDAFNTYPLLKGGIKPLTICSDLLKPGGYERLAQYTKVLKEQMQQDGVRSIDNLSLPPSEIADYLDSYITSSMQLFHRDNSPGKSIKNSRPLNYFDCISAPCQSECATGQDIPTYLYLTSKGRFAEALQVIRGTNPLPNSTGMACDHLCQEQCTRINYDRPIQIRAVKQFIAQKEKEGQKITPLRKLTKRVAIIGAGPSGLSAAFFLAMEGFKVEIFEANSTAGGMLSYAIPDFRLSKSEVEMDLQRIEELGVAIHYNHKIKNQKQFNNLYQQFDYLYLAIGAASSIELNIPGETSDDCHDFLSFLKQVKGGKITSLPNDTVIIGGGNSAIDAARTALRLMPKGSVPTILYRRTIEQMPAYQEEIDDLLREGINVLELAAPLEVVTQGQKCLTIRCQKMQLNAKADRSGRIGVTAIPNSEFNLASSYIIKAIGQTPITSFLPENLLPLESKKSFLQTKDPKVFMGGDLPRGGSSIIQAVADGKDVAYEISRLEKITPYLQNIPQKDLTPNHLLQLKSLRQPLSPKTPPTPLVDPLNFLPTSAPLSEERAVMEASRCLYCDERCDQCVTVCPNRANISYQVDTNIEQPCQQQYQTLNIADFCNECGNCATFCPTAGAPYIDKPRLFLDREAFEREQQNAFHIYREEGDIYKLIYKDGGKTVDLDDKSMDQLRAIKQSLLKSHLYLFE
jgi:putative selenate reductase